MKTTLSETEVERVLAKLSDHNHRFTTAYPGEPGLRQPLHTVYGGAHLFRAETTTKLGELAIRHLEEYAPDSGTLAQALGWTDPALAERVYERVVAKLKREPVEDFRIDFEDGFGHRPDAEEDEGYLLAVIYDAGTQRSELLVLDARNLAEEIAVVPLKNHVPHGFHCAYMPL